MARVSCRKLHRGPLGRRAIIIRLLRQSAGRTGRLLRKRSGHHCHDRLQRVERPRVRRAERTGRGQRSELRKKAKGKGGETSGEVHLPAADDSHLCLTLRVC